MNTTIGEDIKDNIKDLFSSFRTIVVRAWLGTSFFRRKLMKSLYEILLDYESLFETRVNLLKSILAKPSDKSEF